MSHRTKLIIAAIFLVLIAIPAAYVIRTWHPTNPLRFRFSEVHPEADLKKGIRKITVTVENASDAPVQLYGASIEVPNSKGRAPERAGFCGPWSHSSIGGASRPVRFVVVPARGTTRITAELRTEYMTDGKSGRLQVTYHWMSVTKSKSAGLFKWIHGGSPQWLRSLSPDFKIKPDIAPLEGVAE
ncbi:hypothetical protein [Roseimicrobium sp. ORNL1]|uniref:hypothetical protein n=1 Tax=Roseimicrobium sp. ORNL1 TaxID=2711231 RepID=UPI0013E15DC0|nr:hypothetical protein [Roseimicrobium sp. ORNL1]QIF01952.1 hypothetical protein G5S37_10565 [Roseimicrobium sp. ORNL1]